MIKYIGVTTGAILTALLLVVRPVHAVTNTLTGQLISVGSSTIQKTVTVLVKGTHKTISVDNATAIQNKKGASMSLGELLAGDTVSVSYKTDAGAKTVTRLQDVSWNGAPVQFTGSLSSVSCGTLKVKSGATVKTAKIHGGTPILRSNVNVGCLSLVKGETVTVYGTGTSTISVSRMIVNFTTVSGTVTKIDSATTDGSVKLTVKKGVSRVVVTATLATQYFGKQNKLGGLSMVKVGHHVDVHGIKKGSAYLASSIFDTSTSLGVGAKLVGTLRFSNTVATASNGGIWAASSTLVGQVSVEGWGQVVAVSGNYAFVVGTGSGMQVVDLSDVKEPRVVGTIVLGGTETVVAASGHFVFVGSELGLSVVDVSTPAHPVKVGFVSFIRHVPSGSGQLNPFNDYVAPSQIVVSGTTVAEYGMYSTDLSHGKLALFDVSDPTSPKLASTIDTFISWQGTIPINGNILYTIGSQGGFSEYDISDPYNPMKLQSNDTTFCGTDDDSVTVSFSGTLMYCFQQPFTLNDLRGYVTSDGGLNYTQVSQVPMKFDTITMSGNHLYGITRRDDSMGQRPKIAEFDVSDPAQPKLKNMFYDSEFYVPADENDEGGAVIQSMAVYGEYIVVLRPADLAESAPDWVRTVRTPAKLFLIQFND